MFPNPTSGEINIQVGNAVEGVIEVRDVRGQLISTQAIVGSSNELNVTAASGMYFVTIISNGARSETKRLIVQ
jgi:hypothetical protein